jgi:hypothetical protein
MTSDNDSVQQLLGASMTKIHKLNLAMQAQPSDKFTQGNATFSYKESNKDDPEKKIL